MAKNLKNLLEENADFEAEMKALMEELDASIGGEMQAVTADDKEHDIHTPAEDVNDGGLKIDNSDSYPEDEHREEYDIKDSEVPIQEELEKGSPESTENREAKEIADGDVSVTNSEVYPADEHKQSEETKVEGEQEDPAKRSLTPDQVNEGCGCNEEDVEPEIKAPHKDPDDFNKELEDDGAEVTAVKIETVPAEDPVVAAHEVDPMKNIDESFAEIFKVLRESELEKGAPESTENREAHDIPDGDISVTNAEVYPADEHKQAEEIKVDGVQEDPASKPIDADRLAMNEGCKGTEFDDPNSSKNLNAKTNADAEKRRERERKMKQQEIAIEAKKVGIKTESQNLADIRARLASLSESEIDAILEELEKSAPESTENRAATEIADGAVSVSNAEVYPADEHKQAEETKVEGVQEDPASKPVDAARMEMNEELEKGGPTANEVRDAHEMSASDVEVTNTEVYTKDDHSEAEEIPVEGKQEDDASRELPDKTYDEDSVVDDLVEMVMDINEMNEDELSSFVESLTESELECLEEGFNFLAAGDSLLEDSNDRTMYGWRGAYRKGKIKKQYDKAIKNKLSAIDSQAKAATKKNVKETKATQKANYIKTKENNKAAKKTAKADIKKAIKSGNFDELNKARAKLNAVKSKKELKKDYKENRKTAINAVKKTVQNVANAKREAAAKEGAKAKHDAMNAAGFNKLGESVEELFVENGIAPDSYLAESIKCLVEELEKGAPESTENRAATEIADGVVEVKNAEVYSADEHAQAEEIKVEGEIEDPATRELPSKDYDSDKTVDKLIESLNAKGLKASKELVESVINELGVAGIAPLDVPASMSNPTVNKEGTEIKADITFADVYPTSKHKQSEEIPVEGNQEDDASKPAPAAQMPMNEELEKGAPESTENRDAHDIPDGDISVTNAEVYPADEHKQAEEIKVNGVQEDPASKPVPAGQMPIVKEGFVAYKNLKEAFMLDEGYFSNDSYVKVLSEEKIDKLSKQMALLMCKESVDPIFSELVKYASYVKRLQEAAFAKYGEDAKKKAIQLVEAKEGCEDEDKDEEKSESKEKDDEKEEKVEKEASDSDEKESDSEKKDEKKEEKEEKDED